MSPKTTPMQASAAGANGRAVLFPGASSGGAPTFAVAVIERPLAQRFAGER
jgi:hypothetical protein